MLLEVEQYLRAWRDGKGSEYIRVPASLCERGCPHPLILLPDVNVQVVLGCISGPKRILVTDTDLKTDAQTYRGLM